MKKEILTRDIIKKDCISKVKKDLSHMLPTFAYLIVVIAMILFLCLAFDVFSDGTPMLYIFLVVFAILFIGSIFMIFGIIKDFFVIKKNKFLVVLDVLVQKEDGSGVTLERFVSPAPYYLRFSKYGKVPIYFRPLAENYDSFGVNDRSKFVSAELADTFYLVVYKSNVFAVYNTKFFEFIEDNEKHN